MLWFNWSVIFIGPHEVHVKRGEPDQASHAKSNLRGVGTLRTLGLPSLVVANPLPDAAIFTHVQTQDPNFCTNHGVASCEDITQITTETGLLEFGLFFQPVSGLSEPIEGVAFEATWPEGWSYRAIDVCCGTYSSALTGNEIVVTITTDPGYQMNEFFVIANITLDVATAGRFAVTSAEVILEDIGSMWIDAIPAWAGVPCGNCTQPCDYEDACLARAEVDFLEMSATQGSQAQTVFRGWASGFSTLCDVAFESPSEFLSVEFEFSAMGGYDVTVTADATGLALGYHFGYVRAYTSGGCEMCIPVYFTVTPGTPTQRTTWGGIKGVFR